MSIKFFLLLLFLPLSSALNLTDINLTQQNDICEILNFGFIECYELWSFVLNYGLNDSCVDCNVNLSDCEFSLNKTKFDLNLSLLNNSVLFDKLSNSSFCSVQDDLLKIDDYSIRGFEPVFEKGIIVNWAKKKNDSCEAFDCTVQCMAAVESVRQQCNNTSQVGLTDSQKQNRLFLYGFIGIIVLLGLYFGVKKYFKDKSISEFEKKPYVDFEHVEPKLSKLSEPPVPEVFKGGLEEDDEAF